MRHFILRTVFLLFFISCFSVCTAEQFSFDTDSVFNSRLTDEEKKLLLDGGILMRNTGTYRNICLKAYDAGSEKIISGMQELKPVFLSEIIQIVPVAGHENLIQKLNSVLSDISSYKGIPYYSEHNDVWVDLYSDAFIISEETETDSSGNFEKHSIRANFYMEPFGEILSDIKIVSSSDSLFYENENSDFIKYSTVKCVSPRHMKSAITVFKSGGFWVLYGIGGVNAPQVPFLTKRIELSFMNRIKTFCNFVFEKLRTD